MKTRIRVYCYCFFNTNHFFVQLGNGIDCSSHSGWKKVAGFEVEKEDAILTYNSVLMGLRMK